jgi:preprotein translocase subunit SecD
MSVATEVVRKRIDALGTREPTIIRQGADRIVVQVPGLKDPTALKELLGQTAKLEFKLVDTTASPTDVPRASPLRVTRSCPMPAAPGPWRSSVWAGSRAISSTSAKQVFEQQTGERRCRSTSTRPAARNSPS